MVSCKRWFVSGRAQTRCWFVESTFRANYPPPRFTDDKNALTRGDFRHDIAKLGPLKLSSYRQEHTMA